MVLEYNHNHDHQHHIHDHGHHQHHHYHHAGIINTVSRNLFLTYFWAAWSLINKDKQIIWLPTKDQKMTVLESCCGNNYIQPGWRPYLKNKMFLLCFSSYWVFLRSTVFLNTVNLDNSMHWKQNYQGYFLLNNHHQ